MSEARAQVFSSISSALRPPEDISYAEWAEKNFRLSGNSAAKGKFRPWKFQKGILDAIGDPEYSQVSILKSTRTGYTISLMAALGATAVNDPCPMILVMPTEDDASEIVVDELDPSFDASPALRGLMNTGKADGKNTSMKRTLLGGASIKILNAAAPRKLRRHTAKIVYCDEIDGMKITKEGNPITIARERFNSYPDGKLVVGSTPVDDTSSLIMIEYEGSDQRIFKVPCLSCNEKFELQWEQLDWEPGKPETAMIYCPFCEEGLEERFKSEMLDNGDWFITKPEVKGHAGFRMNALMSKFAKVSWGSLAHKYEEAQRAPGDQKMKAFWNLSLGRTWNNATIQVKDSDLDERLERFGLKYDISTGLWAADIPEEVAYITVGCDVQDNRIEATILGWSETSIYLLGHHIVYGNVRLKKTWDDLDGTLMLMEWDHPLGGRIGVESGFVDSSDGDHTQYVYDYAESSQANKVFASKGRAGAHKIIQISQAKRANRTAPLFLIAVDTTRGDVLSSLKAEPFSQNAMRLSDTLSEEYRRQLVSMRKITKLNTEGTPVNAFENVGNRRREALDSCGYGIAASKLVQPFDFAKRYEELKGNVPNEKSLKDLVSNIHKRGK